MSRTTPRQIEAADDFELLRLLLEDVARFERERAVARAEAREQNRGLWTADAALLAEERCTVVDEAVAPIEMEEAPDGIDAVRLDLTSPGRSPSTDGT